MQTSVGLPSIWRVTTVNAFPSPIANELNPFGVAILHRALGPPPDSVTATASGEIPLSAGPRYSGQSEASEALAIPTAMPIENNLKFTALKMLAQIGQKQD